LGGDSEVHVDREARLRVGPRKVMPLCLLATRFPGLLTELRTLAAAERVAHFAAWFAWRNPADAPPASLDRLEQRVWEALGPAPRSLAEVARTTPGAEAVRRLVDRGFATLAGFTPSDALHVLGKQQGWSVEAARLGAAVLALEERNAGARREAVAPEVISQRVYEHMVCEGARVVIECALAQDPGIEPHHGRWGPLGRLLEDMVSGRPFSRLVQRALPPRPPLPPIAPPP